MTVRPGNTHPGDVLLVIAGCEKDEEAIPFIIGAFNEEYINQIPIEDSDEMIASLKEKWTMEPSAYEWREIRVLVPADALDRAFDRVEVEGTILP